MYSPNFSFSFPKGETNIIIFRSGKSLAVIHAASVRTLGSRSHMNAAAEPYRQYSAPPVGRFLGFRKATSPVGRADCDATPVNGQAAQQCNCTTRWKKYPYHPYTAPRKCVEEWIEAKFQE